MMYTHRMQGVSATEIRLCSTLQLTLISLYSNKVQIPLLLGLEAPSDLEHLGHHLFH
jgi:hypothetical protein